MLMLTIRATALGSALVDCMLPAMACDLTKSPHSRPRAGFNSQSAHRQGRLTAREKLALPIVLMQPKQVVATVLRHAAAEQLGLSARAQSSHSPGVTAPSAGFTMRDAVRATRFQ